MLRHPDTAGGRSKLTGRLENSEDLVTGDALDLGNAVGVTEDNADLRRGHALLGELEDLVGDLLRGGLYRMQP